MNKQVDRVIDVPTGKILIVHGEKGKLECLSIGDYGKQHNIKADFLDMPDEINGVPNGEIMPLEEKWVITISTQYGCSMGCTFCDVPKVGPGINATEYDLCDQVYVAIKAFPEVKHTKRLNLHFARMGEPTWNNDILSFVQMGLRGTVKKQLGNSMIHPVISTMLPKANSLLIPFLNVWCDIKNDMFRGDAGLQFSINSTDDKERDLMFNGNAHSMAACKEIAESIPDPIGRKYALNFAVCGYTVDANLLAKTFHPDKFMCKLTPMHETTACKENNLITVGGYDSFYPYAEMETNLKNAGFDVLVFVPSKDEDESRITCGNAILADKD
jgi:23S rRNA (adenine2503-C2)-methyltransferase